MQELQIGDEINHTWKYVICNKSVENNKYYNDAKY